MFKITIETENSILTVKLHGNFTAEYVREVEKALSLNGYSRRKVFLDLGNVIFVDRGAMELLRRIKATTINIRNTPSYVTRWIEQEAS